MTTRLEPTPTRQELLAAMDEFGTASFRMGHVASDGAVKRRDTAKAQLIALIDRLRLRDDEGATTRKAESE